jgi:hypothetical protein
MTNIDHLKLCPFCGSRPMLLKLTTNDWDAFCEDCGAGPGTRYTREAAIEAWDERTELLPGSQPPDANNCVRLLTRALVILQAKEPDGCECGVAIRPIIVQIEKAIADQRAEEIDASLESGSGPFDKSACNTGLAVASKPGSFSDDFGDVESLTNSRNWLETAVKAKGAKVTGGGMGMGACDVTFTLEGFPYAVTMRPR